MMRGLWSGLVLGAAVVAAPVAAQQSRPAPKPDPMTFELVTNDPAAPRESQTRWVAARGSIMPDTAKVLDAFLAKNDIAGLTIYFDSPGGSVTGSIELGERLRKAEAKVAVGRSIPVGAPEARAAHAAAALPRHQLSPNAGQCNSACPYAFIGGKTRTINSDAFVGVHMFWAGDRITGLYDQKYIASDIERTQRIASRLAAYIQRMGGDLRILEIAATTPHKAPIRRLSSREIVDLKLASIDYGAPVVAKPGNWGLIVSSGNARLVTGGTWSSAGRPDIRYQLEFTCNGFRGFHNVRFELAVATPLEAGKSVAMRRVLLASGTKDAVIAFSVKDIRALPPPFTRLVASRPGSWIAKSGTVVSEVVENAVQRPNDGLRIIIDEGEAVKSEIPVPVGNLPTQLKPWQAACENIRDPQPD